MAGYDIFNEEIMFRWFNMILPERLRKLEIKYYIIGANWSVDDPINLNDGFEHYKRGSKFKSKKKELETLSEENECDGESKTSNNNNNVNIVANKTRLEIDSKLQEKLENNLEFKKNVHSGQLKNKIINNALEKDEIKANEKSINKEEKESLEDEIDESVKNVTRNDVATMLEVNQRDMNRKMGYDWLGYGWSTIYAPFGTILKQSKKLYGTDILYYDIPYKSNTRSS